MAFKKHIVALWSVKDGEEAGRVKGVRRELWLTMSVFKGAKTD